MNIRSAKASDYEEVMKLYNDFAEEDRYSRHDNDSFKVIVASETNELVVAEDDGKLIGFAMASIRSVVRYPKPIAELEELFVSSEYRKHGVGGMLMEAIERFAREQGCNRVYIGSRLDKTTAHTFYENRGYKRYGYQFIRDL